MSDWPDISLRTMPFIHPWSLESLGQGITNIGGVAVVSGAASAAYPSANLAIFVPFFLPRRATIQQLWSMNGGTASGNIDAGIYAEDGTRLVSIGSTAQAGTTVLQAFDVADKVLGPGLYYLAIAKDDTTGTLYRIAPSATVGIVATLGFAQMASAFPLPATATFASYAQNYLPLFGASLRSLV